MKTVPTGLLNILRHRPAPEWALWAAQDRDGSWWAYKAEPLHNDQGWYENEIGQFVKLGDDIPPRDWKSQLVDLRQIGLD